MKDANKAMNPLEDIAVTPEPSKKLLNQRQLIGYRTERENYLEWLLAFGKDPARAEGYAMGTVRNRASRMDQFLSLGVGTRGRLYIRSHERAR